jgi:hypothetical protein
MTITSSLSLWEWRKEKSLFLFPHRIRTTHPVCREPKYSHKKLQVCPITKKLGNQKRSLLREMVKSLVRAYATSV